MKTPYAQHISPARTPQTEPVPGKNMVANSAGGYSFEVDDWTRLDRFLVLGAEGGTYYISERKLTQDNAQAVLKCGQLDGRRTVDRIVEISKSGRAPKNDPAVFALALLSSLSTPETKAMALSAMPEVCRIGTHFFQFVSACNELRGWGRGLRNAVANWYAVRAGRDVRDLSYQLVKYQNREKWTHRDVLRLCHANLGEPINSVLHWAVKGWPGVGEQPHPEPSLLPIWAFEQAKKATSAGEIVRLIRDYRLVRECIPTHFLTNLEVWEALLEEMPMTAMIRNLATMTRIGLLAPLSKATKTVADRLTDPDRLKKARVHPVSILMALRTYASGHGEKSSKTWIPVGQIVTALDEAFYKAFDFVEPTGKRFLLGIDVSGSMSSPVAGTSMSCCEGATAMAMVTAHVEKQTHICAFNTGFQSLPITGRTRLDDALKYTRNVNFGGTDCSLPMTHALSKKWEVDVFVVLTDSETYAGRIHPFQAIKEYRAKTGIPAKLVVIGMTSNGFTIADPSDAGMLDLVGFDSSTPQLLSDFASH